MKKISKSNLLKKVKEMSFQLKLLVGKTNFNEIDIHKLRVNIKRWNAFFKLLLIADFDKRKIKKNKSSLREIFKTAGQIRRYQLILKKKTINFSKIKSALVKHKLNVLNDKFMIVKAKFSAAKFASNVTRWARKITQMLRNEFVIKIRVFIKKQLAAIEKLVHADDIKRIHSARIRIRKILDLSFWLNVVNNPMILSRYKSIHQKIGKWHDHQDYLNYLNELLVSKKGELNSSLMAEMTLIFHLQQTLMQEVRNIFFSVSFLY